MEIPTTRERGKAAMEAAMQSWRAYVGEHARETLDPIFSTAGWSQRAPRYPQSVPEWCGFAAYFWLHAAGMYKSHARSFYHVKNVVAFFTYGAKLNVNPRRLMTKAVLSGAEGAVVPAQKLHADHKMPRLWMDYDAIQKTLPDFQPGDVVLIRHRPSAPEANHIALVLDFYPDQKTLVTLEGNASGVSVNGPARDAVVRLTRPMEVPAMRRMIWGWGRPSALDYRNAIVSEYVA